MNSGSHEIAEARRLVDEAWAQLGQWDARILAAQALLEQARDTHPDDPQVLTCLGALLCDRALYREAEAVLRQALALGSIDRNTRFNLAVAVLNTGTRKQALALFAQSNKLQASPLTWTAYFDPHAQ